MKKTAIQVLVIALSFSLFGTALAAKNVKNNTPTTKIFRVNR